LAAERENPGLFSGAGVTQAIEGINDIRQFGLERDIRRGIEDERQAGQGGSPFESVLSRAGEAGRSEAKIPTIGSFDETRGSFRRPVFAPPSFNPNQPDPRAGLGGAGGFDPFQPGPEGISPQSGFGQQDPRFDPEVDRKIGEFNTKFGDTGALVAQRERQRQLSQQIAAIGDLPEREQRLIRAGVITPQQALQGLGAAEADQQQQLINQQVFERLRAADPDDPFFATFLPGVDYVAQFGTEREKLLARELEEFKQEATTERTRIQEAGRNRRFNVGEAGRNSRAAARQNGESVDPNLFAAALNMLSGGFSRQEAVLNLTRSGVEPGAALSAVEKATDFDDGGGDEEEPQPLPVTDLEALADMFLKDVVEAENLDPAIALNRVRALGLTKKDEKAFRELIKSRLF